MKFISNRSCATCACVAKRAVFVENTALPTIP